MGALADQTVDARWPSLLEVERLRLFDIRSASSQVARKRRKENHEQALRHQKAPTIQA